MEDKDNSIFRQKSMERVSSPERLNDYVKVVKPGLWLLLTAIIVLLLGVCAWGIWGKIDVKRPIGILSEKGQAICLIPENVNAELEVGDVVEVQGKTGTITTVTMTTARVDEIEGMSEYLKKALNLTDSDRVYLAAADIEMADGDYSGIVIIESISPISFVLN